MAKIAFLKGDKPDELSEAFKTVAGLKEINQDDYELVLYKDVLFDISNESVVVTWQGTDLADFDLVYLRDFQGYEFERNAIAAYLDSKKRKYVNGDVGTFQHISKLTQYLAFALENVTIPRTLFGFGDTLLQAANQKLTYPVVAKGITANSGNDNFFVNNAEELSGIIAEHGSKKLVVQEAIPNDGDYRLIVLGEKVGCVYHRLAKAGDHRNNVSQGGDKEYVPVDSIDPAILALSVKAAKAVRREICGVDIMVNTQTRQPVLLEANFNFGIRAIPGVISEELYSLSEYLHDKALES